MSEMIRFVAFILGLLGLLILIGGALTQNIALLLVGVGQLIFVGVIDQLNEQQEKLENGKKIP
jgi:hypothetical protein